MKARSGRRSGWRRASLVGACLWSAACGAVARAPGPAREPERLEEVTASDPAPPSVPPPAPIEPCTSWSESVELGRLGDARLGEVSGLLASRAHAGVLYVQNDSGEPYARVFAIEPEGRLLAEIVIDGAPSRDFEDLAFHDGWVYVADTGDNGARDASMPVRDDPALLRFREPELPVAGGTVHVQEYERIALRFAERPRDVEAVFVEPTTGDVFLLTKENAGPADVFVARAPLATEGERTVEHVLTLPGGRSLADAITAADISADGRLIVVRTYRGLYAYARAVGESVEAALARPPIELPVLREWQGEAIALSLDGRTLYSIPEGDAAAVHALRAQCP